MGHRALAGVCRLFPNLTRLIPINLQKHSRPSPHVTEIASPAPFLTWSTHSFPDNLLLCVTIGTPIITASLPLLLLLLPAVITKLNRLPSRIDPERAEITTIFGDPPTSCENVGHNERHAQSRPEPRCHPLPNRQSCRLQYPPACP